LGITQTAKDGLRDFTSNNFILEVILKKKMDLFADTNRFEMVEIARNYPTIFKSRMILPHLKEFIFENILDVNSLITLPVIKIAIYATLEN